MTQLKQTCPICHYHATLRYQNHIGYQEQSKFDIYHCDFCKVAFVMPLEVDELLYEHIYKNASQMTGYERYVRYAEQVLSLKNPLEFLAFSEDIYWGIQQTIRKKKADSIKILEVGCGLGYLTYAIKKEGFDIVGLDISYPAIEYAKKNYGDFFYCEDIKEHSKKGKSYDMIIMTEVIEHVKDVRRLFKTLLSLLSPAGEIIVTTPNRSAYPKDVLWETELPPIHLWWFSEKSMIILADQFNFNTKFINYRKFNKLEFIKNKTCKQSFKGIRGFLPTQLPQLDCKGNLLQKGKLNPYFKHYTHFTLIEKKNEIKNHKRGLFKKFLTKVGLFKIIKYFLSKFRFFLEKRKLLFNKRTTLCVVFKRA